jgi:hypothetical protein
MSLPQKHSLDVRNPFTRADARAAGMTVKELISRRYQKVFYNLYVSANVRITPQLRARAALRLASPAATSVTPQLPSSGAFPCRTMTILTSPCQNMAVDFGDEM